MKQKIYVLGVITALVIFTGAIFKVNHWPAAGIMLIVGLVTLVAGFVPAALVNLYKSEGSDKNLVLYIVTGLSCLVVYTGMLFKIQHWPGAGILLTIALPFPYVVFLPVFLRVTSKNKNFNIYNVVAVLTLLAFNSVFAALLSLNVSLSRIEESYNLSENYFKLEKVLEQMPVSNTKSPLEIRIDGVIKIVSEYQDLILKSEGISYEQWKGNPGNLLRPDARAVAAEALFEAEGLPIADRLEKGLKGLIMEMGSTKGYEELAKVAPLVFGIEEQADSDTKWGNRTFRDNNLAWVLIYLDAMETNLLMIKTSDFR